MPDLSDRGQSRAAIKDIAWGYVSEREAGAIADELLDVLPGLIRKHPLAFGLVVDQAEGYRREVTRVVSEWTFS